MLARGLWGTANTSGRSAKGAVLFERWIPVEIALVVRELLSRKRLLVIGLIASAAFAVLSVERVVGLIPPRFEARSLMHAGVYTQAVIDTNESFIGNNGQQLGPIIGRAIVDANLMASPGIVDLIGQYAGIDPSQIWAAGPVDPSLQRAVVEPTPGKRNVQVAREANTYRLEFLADPNLPTIGIYAQAPTTGQGVALANAAVRALATYVRGIENKQNTPKSTRVTVRQIGQPVGGIVNGGIKKKLAGMVFVFVFAVWCVLVLIGIRARAAWRASRIVADFSTIDTLEETDRDSTTGRRAKRRRRAEQTESHDQLGRSKVDTVMSRMDAFPHTRRPLPWVLAAFLVMIFFVPVDQTDLRVHLPFNSKFDRFAVMAMVGAWVVLGGDQRTFWRSRRFRHYAAALALFVAIAIASLLADSFRVINLNQWTLAQKQIAVLISFAAASWFAMTALRPEDLKGLSALIIVLGIVLALGMLVESRTGYNVFYEVSRIVLKPIARVGPAPTSVSGLVVGVVGPTSHGLAAATVLAIAMPFALVRVFELPVGRSWLFSTVAVGLMVAAGMATQKKTALLAFMAGFLFIAIKRPRRLLQLLPLVILLIGFVHVVSPGSLGAIFDPARWVQSQSHRNADLPSILPDVSAHPILGRGYGSLDPVAFEDQFRVTDNQILGILWQTGVVGLAAYVWMVISPVVAARKAVRSPDHDLGRVALAASAGCIAFLVANYNFDALGFVQAPYAFFIAAALCTVASGAPGCGRVPAAIGPEAPHEFAVGRTGHHQPQVLSPATR